MSTVEGDPPPSSPPSSPLSDARRRRAQERRAKRQRNSAESTDTYVEAGSMMTARSSGAGDGRERILARPSGQWETER